MRAKNTARQIGGDDIDCLQPFALGGATYGILYVTARQPTPVFGETAKGVCFFVVRTTTAACNASTVVPSAISTTGFPSG